MNAGRPEDSATTDPAARRMAWEHQHPEYEIRNPDLKAPRRGYDLIRRSDGARVGGPWRFPAEMMDALEAPGWAPK